MRCGFESRPLSHFTGPIPMRPTIHPSVVQRQGSRPITAVSGFKSSRSDHAGDALKVARSPRKREIAGSIPVASSIPRRPSKSGDCARLKSERTPFDPAGRHHLRPSSRLPTDRMRPSEGRDGRRVGPRGPFGLVVQWRGSRSTKSKMGVRLAPRPPSPLGSTDRPSCSYREGAGSIPAAGTTSRSW